MCKEEADLIAFDREQGPIVMSDSTTLFENVRIETFMATIPDDIVLKYGMDPLVPVSVEVKEFTLYYSSFDNSDSSIHIIMQKLREVENADLLIRIDSTGGSFNEGLQLLKVMKECFHGRTTGYLDAEALSMGAMTFVACDKRVVDEYSSIMFHNYSAGIAGSGNNMAVHLANNDKIMKRFSRDLLLKPGFITEDEYNTMIVGSAELWYDAEEMCNRNIATHVNTCGYELTADEYLAYLASGKDIEEFISEEDDADTI